MLNSSIKHQKLNYAFLENEKLEPDIFNFQNLQKNISNIEGLPFIFEKSPFKLNQQVQIIKVMIEPE